MPNPDLNFWNSNLKINFRAKTVPFAWKLTHTRYLEDADFYSSIRSDFPTLNPFLGKFGKKNSKFPFCSKISTQYLEDVDSYSDISFPNFRS